MSDQIATDTQPRLILGGKLVQDDLRRFEPPAQDSATQAGSDSPAPAAGEHRTLPPDELGWLLPVSVWLAHDIGIWRQRRHAVALLISPDTELDDLFAHSALTDLQAHVALIAIDFPAYTDGRGYSLAQLLRQQYGWQGELRAVGDVMIDTMHYLARCGFDSFLVKPGHDPHKALAALATFTQAYQKSYRHSAEVAKLAPAA